MNIVIGRYLPLDSWMHRRDPRFKLISMILLIIALFLPIGFEGYFIMAAFLALGLFLSKISFRYVLQSLKPMIFMMFFLFIVNIFVIKTGNLLIDFAFIQIYDDAIFQSLFIFLRLLLMVTITTLLTLTTKPMDLTMAIEDLLKPFNRIGVPSHEIAMIISIALRFIPTLIDEAQRIMKAQASRGVDFNEGKIMERIASMMALIIPLFASSFQRAEELADAMEARGYQPSAERTRYRQFVLNFSDYLLLLANVMILIIAIWWTA